MVREAHALPLDWMKLSVVAVSPAIVVRSLSRGWPVKSVRMVCVLSAPVTSGSLKLPSNVSATEPSHKNPPPAPVVVNTHSLALRVGFAARVSENLRAIVPVEPSAGV